MLADVPVPWPNDQEARRFLSGLAHTASGRTHDVNDSGPELSVDRPRVAAWLTSRHLSALGFADARLSDPVLAGLLKRDAVDAAVGNLAHFETLDRIERAFAAAGIGMVLLKGAAVADDGYADRSLRPMVDLDIWVRNAEMDRATRCLLGLGFQTGTSAQDRPPALQRLSCGEAAFRDERCGGGLVELHYGPFQGWWIQRAAAPDSLGIWRRSVAVGPGRHARRLAAEDAVLQIAFHVAVNQFGQAPFRGLMDLAVIARAHRIDWDAVVERARAWRLRTLCWLVLDVADRLIGVPGAWRAISRLAPAAPRRAALRALVNPRGLLAGRHPARPSRRHALMLALIDRPSDGARAIGRTLWPERWWIEARYGRPVSRAAHVLCLARRGRI